MFRTSRSSWCVAVLLPAAWACTGTLTDDGKPSASQPSGSSGAAGSGSGGGATVTQVPEQPIDTLTCTTRIAPDGRIWRLTPEQFRSSMSDAFGHVVEPALLPKDGLNQRTGFSNDSNDSYVTVQFADAVWDAGAAAATAGVAVLQQKFPCLNQGADDTCLTNVVQAVAGRAFRRPLQQGEAERYVTFYKAQAVSSGASVALRMLQQVIANSAQFLYRTELGSGEKGLVTLTQPELAAKLSFQLTDAPPSPELMAAAMQGELSNRSRVAELARGLLQTPSARDKLNLFVAQFLQLGGLTNQAVEPQLADSMLQSVQAFVSDVAWSPGGTFTDLMTSPRGFVNQDLAPLYGVAATGPALQRVDLDPAQRGGLLTQAAFLTVKHGPIHRGRLIKEGLFCGVIPEPPPGASLQRDKLEGPDPDATEQERFTAFKQLHPCGDCHLTFQPLGIALDHYDELGRYRTTNAAGRPIDASGVLVGAGDADGAFVDGLELGRKIAGSAAGRYCFVKRYMSFAEGREVTTGRDACALKAVGDGFIEQGLKLSELLVALTQDDAFYQRNNTE